MPNAQTLNRSAIPPRQTRRAANVTLPEALIREARALDINISQACEKGLAVAVSEAQAAAWLKENRPAIDAWNDHIHEHGIPLAEFRQF
jgi:antitoxin CcdA